MSSTIQTADRPDRPWLDRVAKAHIPTPLAVIFFLVLPALGGYLVLLAIQARLGWPWPGMLAAGLPALLAGALATRRPHVVAYALGFGALFGFLWMLGGGVMALADYLLIAIAAAMFVGAYRIRRAWEERRALLLAAGGTALAAALLLAAPMLYGLVMARGHLGWYPVGSADAIGYDFALPGTTSSYLLERSSGTYTFYGAADGGGDVLVRGEALDREMSSVEYARQVDRQDDHGWGVPDASDTVVIGEIEWVVRDHDQIPDRIGTGEATAVADAVATSGLVGAHIGVRVPASDGTAGARAFLLEVLETVEFSP